MIFDIWNYEKFIDQKMLDNISNGVTTPYFRSLGYESAMYHGKGYWYMDDVDFTVFLLRWS